jgi:UDP-2,3-diacylglucosamine hydrolase
MADAQHRNDPLAIICGGGSFPAAVADAVARRGRRPVMFGIKGWADAAVIERYTHHWISIGQAGRFFRLARAENCRDVLFIGTVLRPPISQLRLDWQTIKLMPRVIRFFRGGDDKLLSGVAGVAESGGLRVVGVKDVAPEVFVAEGVLGRHAPSERDKADIAHALTVIGALGPFDIGQAAVVANNHVLAVEAAEGTDNMLARIAELRKLGRVTTPLGVGVLVKAPKRGQDRRFDLPSIGPRTIDNIVRAGLAGLAVAAGSTMIAEADQAIAAADRAGIFLVGVREDPVR